MLEGPPLNSESAGEVAVETLPREEVVETQRSAIPPEDLERAMIELGITTAPAENDTTFDVLEKEIDPPPASIIEQLVAPAPQETSERLVEESNRRHTEALLQRSTSGFEDDRPKPLPQPEVIYREKSRTNTTTTPSHRPDNPGVVHGTHYDRMHGSPENIHAKAFGSGLLSLLNTFNPKAWLRYRQMMREYKDNELARKTYTTELL